MQRHHGQLGVPKIGFPGQFGNGAAHFHAYALGSAVSHTCFRDAKAQELPRLNRSSMHNLATGTFIFCRALESILSSSSSDPGVCQVSISVTVTYILNKSSHQSRDSTICTTKMCVSTHPRAKVLTPIEVII
jgi:hypothetical protein